MNFQLLVSAVGAILGFLMASSVGADTILCLFAASFMFVTVFLAGKSRWWKRQNDAKDSPVS